MSEENTEFCKIPERKKKAEEISLNVSAYDTIPNASDFFGQLAMVYRKQERRDNDQDKDIDSLKADSKEHGAEIEKIKNVLAESLTVSRNQGNEMSHARHTRVVDLLGGNEKSRRYKKYSHIYFSCMKMDFRRKFDIAAYADLPIKEYKEALNFIELWEPNNPEDLIAKANKNRGGNKKHGERENISGYSVDHG